MKIRMLTGISGPEYDLSPKAETDRFSENEAIRLMLSDQAEPADDESSAALERARQQMAEEAEAAAANQTRPDSGLEARIKRLLLELESATEQLRETDPEALYRLQDEVYAERRATAEQAPTPEPVNEPTPATAPPAEPLPAVAPTPAPVDPLDHDGDGRKGGMKGVASKRAKKA